MTRFTDPRRQADYEMARKFHAKCMSGSSYVFNSYKRGYALPERRDLAPERTAVSYVFWAAGRDNARLDRRRRAKMGKRA